MERLILSEGMTGFSIRAGTSGLHQGDVRMNGMQANGLLSRSIGSEEPCASGSASSSLEGGLDLPNKFTTNSGSSLLLHGAAEWLTAPNLPSMSSFIPNGATQAVLVADLGSDEGVAHVGGSGAYVAVETPEKSRTGQECSRWEGATDGTRNKDEFAVEDWLEVSHALLDTVDDRLWSRNMASS